MFDGSAAASDRVRRRQHLQLRQLRGLRRLHPDAAGDQSELRPAANLLDPGRRAAVRAALRVLIDVSTAGATGPTDGRPRPACDGAHIAAVGCLAVLPHRPGRRGAAAARAPRRRSARSRPMRSSRICRERSFMFFWEQADPATGIIRDRPRTDGSAVERQPRQGSAASPSVGFGLTGMCIAAERGWLPREAILARTRTTLRIFAEKAQHKHGWFYHWLNLHTGAREWQSEVSSIDTALLLGGVLTRAAVLRRRSRDRAARRRDLPARRFHVDAERPSRRCCRMAGGRRRGLIVHAGTPTAKR